MGGVSSVSDDGGNALKLAAGEEGQIFDKCSVGSGGTPTMSPGRLFHARLGRNYLAGLFGRKSVPMSAVEVCIGVQPTRPPT